MLKSGVKMASAAVFFRVADVRDAQNQRCGVVSEKLGQ